VQVAGAAPYFTRCYVYEESVYDNFHAASAVGSLTAAQVNSEADTALVDYDGLINADLILRTVLAADYFDPAVDTVANVTTVANMRGTDGVDTAPMRGTNSAILAVSAPTNWSDLSITATTGRVDIAAVAGTAQTANNNSADINAILVQTTAGGAGTWTTGAGGSAPTVAAIADGVWDELRAGHTATGSFGEFVPADAQFWNGTAISTPLQTANDFTAAWAALPCASPVAGTLEFQLCTDLDAVLADTNELQTDDYPTRFVGIEGAGFLTGTHSLAAIRARGDVAWLTGAGGSSPTVEQIRIEMDTNSAIVADTNILQTEWADGGRLDLLLDGAASAGDPWLTALPGAYGAGTAGNIIGNLNNLSTVQMRSEMDAALLAYDSPTDAEFIARSVPSDTYFNASTDTVDVGAISGDAFAADNAERFFDGTGYNGENNTIGAVTTVSILNGYTLRTGTCDSGSTTTCVDAALTQGNDYWKGNAIVMTSGAAAGQTSCIYSFTAASDTVLFRPMTAAVSTDNYIIVENAVCEGVVAP